jgi:hypothetical protein
MKEDVEEMIGRLFIDNQRQQQNIAGWSMS